MENKGVEIVELFAFLWYAFPDTERAITTQEQPSLPLWSDPPRSKSISTKFVPLASIR